MYSLSTCLKTAAIIFPILAMGLTIPYILVQYHKYGSFILFRAVIVYSFILYLLCAYLLVILPLPSLDEVARLKTPVMQLHLFQFTNDLKMYTEFSVWTPSTYMDTFLSSVFLQVFYNVIMFVPFGIYLHYYFKRNIFETVLLSFLLSLFFELTQLTGLYGIYQRAYRLFDVDDLFFNTLGGTIGYLMEPLLVWMLPSKEKLNDLSYKKGKKVSGFRRLFSLLVDWFVIFVLLLLIKKVFPKLQIQDILLMNGIKGIGSYFLIIFFYFILQTYLLKGYTLGKKIVNIRIVDYKAGIPGFVQYFVRYILLYGVFLPSGLYIEHLYQYINRRNTSVLDYRIGQSLIFIFLLIGLFFIGQILINIFAPNRFFLYESFSNTREVSTIRPKDED